MLRPQVIRDHGMAEFEFFTSYLPFWDKLEKSNLFLESVIGLRNAAFLDRDWEMVNKQTLEDGGWWNHVARLIGKYGDRSRRTATTPTSTAGRNTGLGRAEYRFRNDLHHTR